MDSDANKRADPAPVGDVDARPAGVHPPAGDLDAWVLSTWPAAVAYAASLLTDRSLAQDIVHDCYCHLLRHSDYDLPRDGRRLLFKSVTHECFKHNSRRRPMVSLPFLLGESGWPGAGSEADDPARVAMCRELEMLLGKSLASLPVRQRAALELKSLGHTLAEIAEALHTSVTNAGALIHRARREMARRLRPHLEDRVG
jgi:RNA polymerase sigma-70 factor (ECF subfamily)